MVTWVIGLSRAGKTTLSKLLYDKLKPQVNNLVLLDGDIVRELFGNDVDHSIEGRRKNAERLSHLSSRENFFYNIVSEDSFMCCMLLQ